MSDDIRGGEVSPDDDDKEELEISEESVSDLEAKDADEVQGGMRAEDCTQKSTCIDTTC
jgi:hypothetical protein